MKKPPHVLDCLKERGLIDTISSDELYDKAKKPIKAYVGFDPTADSLHIGSLVGIVVLRWFQIYGHTPVVILGGATGRIGDPSGKSRERPLLDAETIEKNVQAIRENFTNIFDFKDPRAKPLFFNNDAWFSDFRLIDFLRDVGKHFRLGPMLSKESVRSRLESEEGMSFTEFTYQMLQAYDFYYLLTHHDVVLQMGGSDQWGNITAGIELIRKLSDRSGYGLTFPLLTRSDGKKFGKSEEGAIWLSAEKCSYYQFYQYLVRVSDNDVIKLMRMITFMDMEEIKAIEASMQKPNYVPNSAQQRLAEEVTRMVHGEEGLQTALKVTQAAAPGAESTLDIETLMNVAHDMPNIELKKSEVEGQKFVDIALLSQLVSSKGEATRLIQNGGAYLNNQKVEDPQLKITPNDIIGGQFLLVAAGKKKKILIKIQS